jgi:uncharacterized membrane protein YeaQ/YmgE (transglycosylase-associated protein family)
LGGRARPGGAGTSRAAPTEAAGGEHVLVTSEEESAMGIVMWILFGLIVGVIAKLLTPGREPGGFILTALLGVAGGVLGGYIGRAVGMYPSDRSTGGFFMSIVGAVILLGIYNAIVKHRGKTTV